MSNYKKSKASIWLWLGLLGMAIAGFALWGLSPINHVAEAKSGESFSVDVTYDRFRTIMVRKNATAAIVAHGGMELLDEDLNSLAIDASQDDRPILNAIRGQSKTDLSATREIVVRLTDPQLEADRLTLRQKADVTSSSMRVHTQSKEPAGKLKKYTTTLDASPQNDLTQVDLSVSIRVEMEVPRLFTSRVDKEVQTAANSAANEQATAIQEFIASHADEIFVLPEISKD